MPTRDEMLLQSDLRRLSGTGAVSDAAVVAGPGGWQVVVQIHRTQYPIAAKRGQPRLFRKLETAVAFMQDAGLGQFRVDARGYDRHAQHATRRRPDAAAALKRAHEAKAYDEWFRAQVASALQEADAPDAEWVDHDTVKEDMRRQREALRAKVQPGPH